jgi:hypothetical protein
MRQTNARVTLPVQNLIQSERRVSESRTIRYFVYAPHPNSWIELRFLHFTTIIISIRIREGVRNTQLYKPLDKSDALKLTR